MKRILFIILLSITTASFAQQIDIQLSNYGRVSTFPGTYFDTSIITVNTRWDAYLDGVPITDAYFYRLINDEDAYSREISNTTFRRVMFWGGLISGVAGLYVMEITNSYGGTPYYEEGLNLILVGVSLSLTALIVPERQVRPPAYVIRQAQEYNSK